MTLSWLKEDKKPGKFYKYNNAVGLPDAAN